MQPAFAPPLLLQEQRRGRVRRPRVAIVFSGEYRPGGFDDQGEAAGVDLDLIDVIRGGASHHLALRSPRAQQLLQDTAAGAYDGMGICLACGSYAVVRASGPTRKELRSWRHLLGVPGLTDKQRSYVTEHNELAELACHLLAIMARLGRPAWVENPASRHIPGTPQHWPARAHLTHSAGTPEASSHQ